MLFLLVALRTKYARPEESFTDLVTGMLVVNYPCSSSSRPDVLLEKMRKCFTHKFKWRRHCVISWLFIPHRIYIIKSHIHGENLW